MFSFALFASFGLESQSIAFTLIASNCSECSRFPNDFLVEFLPFSNHFQLILLARLFGNTHWVSSRESTESSTKI